MDETDSDDDEIPIANLRQRIDKMYARQLQDDLNRTSANTHRVVVRCARGRTDDAFENISARQIHQQSRSTIPVTMNVPQRSTSSGKIII